MKTRNAVVRTRFDLACAHRLHCPGLSDAENRALFGKCTNPNGHGHNYRVEPAVELTDRPDGRPALTAAQIEGVVARVIVEPFDHKHLNEDTAEFAPGTGVNPSVENIARVFYERLAPEIAAASGDARLAWVTVWETDRTSATYPGG